MSAGNLVDLVFELGGRLWLENDRLLYKLPPDAMSLLPELKARRREVTAECRRRWLRPGMPYDQWCRQNGFGVRAQAGLTMKNESVN
jgi:hypothetical protein